MVRSCPGFGGSGLSLSDLIESASVGSPAARQSRCEYFSLCRCDASAPARRLTAVVPGPHGVGPHAAVIAQLGQRTRAPVERSLAGVIECELSGGGGDGGAGREREERERAGEVHREGERGADGGGRREDGLAWEW